MFIMQSKYNLIYFEVKRVKHYMYGTSNKIQIPMTWKHSCLYIN